MTSVTRRFRLASLLAAGALAVHELRYALAYGDHAGHEAAAQGHAYLSLVVPERRLGTAAKYVRGIGTLKLPQL